MEQSTQKRALGLKDKIPDIQKTLDTVQFLKSRDVGSTITSLWPKGSIAQNTNTQPTQDDAEPLETSFELNDTLFAKANIEKVDEVYLWLGVRRNPPHSHPIPFKQDKKAQVEPPAP